MPEILPTGWEWVGGTGGPEWFCFGDEQGNPDPELRFAYLRHHIPTPTEWKVWYVMVHHRETAAFKIRVAEAQYGPTWACLVKGHTPMLAPSTDPYSDTPQPVAPCLECAHAQ